MHVSSLIHNGTLLIFIHAGTQAVPWIADVWFTDRGQPDPYQGLLEVYVHTPDGPQWTAVCYNNPEVMFNDGAAAAACRQKNFTTFSSYRSAQELELEATGFTAVLKNNIII